jgi:hypothetical protein
MRFFTFFVSFFVFKIAFAQNASDESIYKTVLYFKRAKNERVFVIRGVTNSRELINLNTEISHGKLTFNFASPYIDDTTWKQIIDKNTLDANEIIVPKIKGYQIKTFSEDTVSALWKEDCKIGWEKFYKIYLSSKGFKEFSKILYSEDKKRAVVYFAYHKQCLNAEGLLYLLEFENESWKIKCEISLWIS